MPERRGMKVICSKTEYMCINKREANGTVRLQEKRWKRYMSLSPWGQLNNAGRVEWVEKSVGSDL